MVLDFLELLLYRILLQQNLFLFHPFCPFPCFQSLERDLPPSGSNLSMDSLSLSNEHAWHAPKKKAIYVPPLFEDCESGNHMIIHCSFAKSFWDYFLCWAPLSWTMPCSLLNLIRQWYVPPCNDLGRKFWNGILHGICWGTWKECNRRIF